MDSSPFFEIRIPHGTTSMIAEEYLDDTDFEVYQDNKVLKLIHHTILHEQKSNYSLIQKNGYTFAIV